MAADVVSGQEPSKSCCAALKEKFQKLEEKRNALRQAVKLLEHQIDKLLKENLDLRKAQKEEQAQKELEREVREKESRIKYELEQKICNLKAEVSLLQKKTCSKAENANGDGLLPSYVLEGETEIKRLRELYEKERKRGELQKKRVEAEKQKAAEARELVKVEKSKAEEDKKLVDIERKKVDEYRHCLETLKIEENEARKQLISERSKAEEANRRTEAEKQKANGEKKRADSETARAEEQKKCAEIDRKKAQDEKICADNFSQQLDEMRWRNEALQKEILELVSAPKCRACAFGAKRFDLVDDNARSQNASEKILKKQLKIEKMQLKHAKSEAKLEKVRNSLLQQELSLLKQAAIQFSHRLNVLDSCFSCGIEGIDGLTEIGDLSKLLRSNSNNSFCGMGLCDLYCQNDDGPMKTHHTTANGFDGFGAAVERTLTQSCIQPSSGICSELESLAGGSVRSQSNNSTIYSTTTSFSDRQLMGSQGRHASVATSPKFAEANSTQASDVTRLSGEVTEMRQDQKVKVEAVKKYRNLVHTQSKNPCLYSILFDGNKYVERRSGHMKKKRKIENSLDSVSCLFPEDKDLLLKIDKNLSPLHDMLAPKNNIPPSVWCQSGGNFEHLRNERCQVSTVDDLHRKHHKSPKKRKIVQKEPCDEDTKENQTYEMGIRCNEDIHFHAGDSMLASQRNENVHACREKKFEVDLIDQSASFPDDSFTVDFMKLLELDNPADEEKCRIAREMPLSPTLPEIRFSEYQASELDYSIHLVQGACFRGPGSEENSSILSYSFDVVDAEISSNQSNVKISDISQGLLSHEVKSPGHLLEEPINSDMKISPTDFNKHYSGSITCILETDSSASVEQMSATKKSHDLVHSTDQTPVLSDVVEHSKPSFQSMMDTKASSGFTHCHHENPVQKYSPVCATKEPNRTFGTTQAMGFLLSHPQFEDKGQEPRNISQSLHDGNHFPERCNLLDNGEIQENGLLNATEAGQSSSCQVLVSHEENGVGKQMPNPGNEVAEILYQGTTGVAAESMSQYFVVFSNTEDKACISRIFHARENCLSRCSIISKTDWMVMEVLCALALEPGLVPKEKACVFFSLLLYNFCAVTNSRCGSAPDYLLCSDTFASQLNRVESDLGTRSLFLELCQQDILFSLIEDFLIGRRVLLCDEVLFDPAGICDLDSIFSFDGKIMFVTSKLATFGQLVSGTIILASICSAVGHVGFVCEASYNILRACRGDSSWVLMALHIFSAICGKKYFAVDTYHLVMTVIKLVVALLERGGGLDGAQFPTPSASGCHLPFSPCVQCPFAENVVSEEEVLSLLLEKLQAIAVSRITIQHLKNPTSSFECILPKTMVNAEENLADGNDLDWSNLDADASCYLSNEGWHVNDQANVVADLTLCEFSDIVSLLELIACYKSWEWIYDKLLPPLFKLLESCNSKECSAGILILIGQLGRLGFNSGGYEQKGINELMCTLSSFLDLSTTKQWDLCVQFAAAAALSCILPLGFQELTENSLKLTVDTSQSGSGVIQTWFSQLSKDQKSLALDVLQLAGVQKHGGRFSHR